MVEKVVYKISDEHPGKTVATRSAWIDSQVFGFSRAIRAFGVERFKKNCNKMVITFSAVESFNSIENSSTQVFGFNHVLSAMFPIHTSTLNHADHHYMSKANKIKEVAKTASSQVKAQAEQIYQAYSVKNWIVQFCESREEENFVVLYMWWVWWMVQIEFLTAKMNCLISLPVAVCFNFMV